MRCVALWLLPTLSLWACTETQRGVEKVDPSMPPSASSPAGLLWWNDLTVAESLELTEAQRGEMDEILRRFQEQGLVDFKQAGKDEQNRYVKELISGTKENASQAAREWIEKGSEPRLRASLLKIDVLFVLNETQRKRLGEQYPDLLRGRWFGGVTQPQRRRPPGAGKAFRNKGRKAFRPRRENAGGFPEEFEPSTDLE